MLHGSLLNPLWLISIAAALTATTHALPTAACVLKELEDVIIKVIKEEWPKLRQQVQGEARNLEKAPEDFDIDLADYFDLIAGWKLFQGVHAAAHKQGRQMQTASTTVLRSYQHTCTPNGMR